MAVHIMVKCFGGAFRIASPAECGELFDRPAAEGGVGAVEFSFESSDCVASDHLPVSPVIAVGRQFHVAIW